MLTLNNAADAVTIAAAAGGAIFSLLRYLVRMQVRREVELQLSRLSRTEKLLEDRGTLEP